MKRKWVMFSLIVALALMVCFAGACAKKTPSPSPSPTVPAPTTTPGPPIKIAISGPMKFFHGQHQWLGAKLAADEINAAGGILVGGVKRPVELVKVNNNELTSITDASLATEKAITANKVDFFISGIKSDSALAIMDVACSYKKVILSAGSSIMQLSQRVVDDYEKYKYWFRPHSTIDYDNRVMTAFDCHIIPRKLREAGIQPKAALFGEKSRIADAAFAAAREEYAKEGVEIVGEWRPSITATDVRAELQAIKAAGATIINRQMGGPNGTAAARQWGELQIPAVMTGSSNVAGMQEHWEATKGYCNFEITYGAIGYGELTPKTKPFWERFEKATGEWPNLFSLWAYEDMYVLKEAIEAAGSTNPDKVVEALENLDYQGVQGRIRFAPNHDVLDDFPEFVGWVALQWQNGKLVPVYPEVVPLQLPPWMIAYWKKS